MYISTSIYIMFMTSTSLSAFHKKAREVDSDYEVIISLKNNIIVTFAFCMLF